MAQLSISGGALISMPRATRPSSRRSTTRDQSAHTQFAESGLGGDRCRGGGTRDRATRVEQVRVGSERARQGHLISPGGVRNVWRRHDLEP